MLRAMNDAMAKQRGIDRLVRKHKRLVNAIIRLRDTVQKYGYMSVEVQMEVETVTHAIGCKVRT